MQLINKDLRHRDNQLSIVMRYFLLLFALHVSILAFAQAPSFEWVSSLPVITGGGSNYNSGYDIETDVFGNVITTGFFSGQMDADPGTGTSIMTSSGLGDAFILKQDSDGNFLWAHQYGGNQSEMGAALTTDSLGNIFVGGYFQGLVDFEPGTGQHIYSASSSDAYLIKLAPNGSIVWVKIFTGTGLEEIQGLDVDALGNIYAIGTFQDDIDIDPGTALDSRVSNGARDLFVVKLDGQGNFIWGRTFGGTIEDTGYEIIVGRDNMVTTTGRTRSNSIDFDPGIGTDIQANHGDYDFFIHRMDSQGNYLWGHMMGGTNSDQGTGLAVDTNNNIIICGKFWDNVDFDPGPNTFTMNAQGAWENFVLKLNPLGQFIWAKEISTLGMSFDTDVHIDKYGNIFSFGILTYNGDMDPGPGTYTLSGSGFNGFIQKMDGNGIFLWAGQFENDETIRAHAMTSDRLGNLYFTGDFKDDGDFDPGSGIHQITNTGNDEVFIVKLIQCEAISTTETIAACAPYIWIDGNSYNQDNNTATHLFQSVGGCDSLVRLDLSILTDTTTDQVSSCMPYTWIDGLTYSENNNTASHTLQNSAGCDSVILLELLVTIIDATIFEQNDTLFCNQFGATYQWIDCASSLPIPNATMQFYAPPVTGNYAVIVYLNACEDTSECTSLIVDDLSGFTLPADTVLCFGDSLVLDVSEFSASYLWHDGSTSSTYKSTQSETIWVELTNNSGTRRDSIDVEFISLEITDFPFEIELCSGESLDLTAGPDNQNYLWSTNSIQPQITISKFGHYSVTVSNELCEQTEEIEVKEASCEAIVVMPNVFTPNADGTNDLFIPVDIQNVVEIHTVILNRWGTTVFETDELNIQWTGENLHEGTYFWRVNYLGTNGEKDTKRGLVQLTR
jgi:gliding motility-associated-like protein